MIWIGVLVVVVWLFWLRSRRRATLSGRDVERPVYSVEPPGRRVGRLKDGRL